MLLFIVFLSSCSYINGNISNSNNKEMIEQTGTIPNGDNLIDNTTIAIPNEYECIRYLNNEEFDLVKAAYNNINFTHEFNKGNIEVYDFYLEQFKKLLLEEKALLDPQTQKEDYLSNFGELSHDYDKNKYYYYFFDMDDDNNPELCISDGTRFVYIFKYELSLDKFILWKNLNTTWLRLLGSKNIYYQRPGSRDLVNEFIQLDSDGNLAYSLKFFQEGYFDKENNQDTTAYMVSLPESNQESDYGQLKKGKDIVYFKDGSNTPFFKVTEEQYYELTAAFFKSIELAEINIKKVSFTYDELFGDL